MTRKLLFIFFFIASLVVAQTKTIILQQGLNGYTGCIDSYVNKYRPDKNYLGIGLEISGTG